MTGLIEYKNSDNVEYSLVRNGIEGNLDIVWRMIDLVRDSVVLDKGFEDFIKQTVKDEGFSAHSDTQSLFTFLYDLVKHGNGLFDGVEYIPDNQGNVESIKDARTTIQDGYGDCDDHAILNATILAILGYSPYFVIAKYPDRESYQHVYTVVYVNGQRYVFDTTIKNGKLNDEVSDMLVSEIGVFDKHSATDGLHGVFRNIKNLVVQTEKNAKSAMPVLSGFLPLGFVGQNIARSLFSGTNEESISEIGSRISGKITDVIIQLQNHRIPIEAAVSLSRKYYAEFLSLNPNNYDAEKYQSIKKNLEKKITYIDNFPSEQDGYSLSVEVNTKWVMTAIVVSIGLLYFVKKR